MVKIQEIEKTKPAVVMEKRNQRIMNSNENVNNKKNMLFIYLWF